MKILKKMLSVLMIMTIIVTTMCVGTVTASADSEYGLKIYSDSSYYYIKVSNIEKAEYDAAFKNSSLKMLPYLYIGFSIDYDIYMFGNMQADTVSVSLFRANDTDIDIGVKGYYKYESASKTYDFYFRMPKTNSNAKKYMQIIGNKNNVSYAVVMFGLFDANNEALYNAYKGKGNPEIVIPEISNMSTSSSAKTKKISSLEFDDVSDYTYTGKARKPAVKIYDGDYKLVKGTDYTLSYKNNKEIGTASVTIKGKGKYTGSKTIKFDIVPKKPTVKVSEKNGKITIKWDEIDGAEKYQIYYSADGGKYKKLVTTSKTSYSTTKLDPDDELKFRVRARTEADDEYYYSSFSKVVELD